MTVEATKAKLSTIIIGLGPHGRRLADAVQKLPQLELTALVDVNTQALAATVAGPETLRLTSLDALPAQHEIGLACIATNGPSHAALTQAALSAGIRRVWIEKPMACSLVECERILQQATAAAAHIAVGHGRRYSPIYQWLREQIVAGRWGELRSLWIQRPGIGLGCNAVHSFDLVRMLTGRNVERVTAWIDSPRGRNPRGEQFVDPGGLVVLECGPGIRATVAQIEDGAGPTCLEIDLTAGRIRLDESSGAVEIIERDLSVKPGPGRPPVFRLAELPPELPTKPDMAQMLQAGLADLCGEHQPVADGKSGLASVEILVAAYWSHRRGNTPVALPLSESDKELWLPVT